MIFCWILVFVIFAFQFRQHLLRRLVCISHRRIYLKVFLPLTKLVSWLILGLWSNTSVGNSGVSILFPKHLVISLSFYPFEWSIKTLPILNVFKLKSLMMAILIVVDIGWNLLATGIMRVGALITSGSAII